jgi:ATP-dependent DNA ligase
VANQLNLRSTILNAEIVALDAERVPRFQLLQQWQKHPFAPVVFYLFDVIWGEGAISPARLSYNAAND